MTHVLLGLFCMLVGGVAIFFRQRSLRANQAESAVFWGKADPYKAAPRAMKAWTLTLNVVIGGVFVVIGFLMLIGVINPHT